MVCGLASALAWTAPRALSAQNPAPTPVSADPEESTAETEAELGQLVARLRSDDARRRREVARQILDLGPADIPAIRARLLAPLGAASLGVFQTMVRVARAQTGGRDNVEPDLLELLVDAPQSREVQVALERVALARALGRIGTADAGRALLPFALAHERIFRLECLRIVKNTLREGILPALIEMRRPDEAARTFARAARESIHRVTPGESVQTQDNALLAEILRAFGSTHQNDALNVIASFLNSDRVQVRDAAREAIAQFGRDAINVLRQTYEDTVGQDPDPAWSAERTATELYRAYDRRRAEEVAQTFEEGLAAWRSRNWDTMLARFEYVLARHPLYERRGEMVQPLVDCARAQESRDALKAEGIYRRALRLAGTGPLAPTIRSSILFLEAERALARGVGEPELYKAAVRADPSNQRAREQLERVEQTTVRRARRTARTVAGVGVLAVAGAGIAWLASMGRRKKRRATEAVVAEVPPSAEGEGTATESAQGEGTERDP